MALKDLDVNNFVTGMATKLSIVDFKTFRQLNKNSPNGTDRLIAYVKNASVGTKGVTVEFQNGRKIEAYYNGDYKKFDKNGKLSSNSGLSTNRCIEKEHICLNIEGQKIWAERFIAICVNIIQNAMPRSYKGWNANVMDGSGSVVTASQLGIPVNLHYDNLEWCLPCDNGKHGQMIRGMKEKTNSVYRFSALDRKLAEIFYTGTNEDLIEYCSMNLFKVK